MTSLTVTLMMVSWCNVMGTCLNRERINGGRYIFCGHSPVVGLQ
jgi:hypothetical protein